MSKSLRQRVAFASILLGFAVFGYARADDSPTTAKTEAAPAIQGLTGQVGDIHTVVEPPQTIAALSLDSQKSHNLLTAPGVSTASEFSRSA